MDDAAPPQIQLPLRELVDRAAAILDLEAVDCTSSSHSDDEAATPDGAVASAVSRCRHAWRAFDDAYLAARRDIYYPAEGPTVMKASQLTAESLLTLNAFIFNLRAIGRALVKEAESDEQLGPKARQASSMRPGDLESEDLASQPSSSGRKEAGTPATRSPPPPLAQQRNHTFTVAAARLCLRFVFCDAALTAGAPPREAAKIALAMALAAAIDHALLTTKECV